MIVIYTIDHCNYCQDSIGLLETHDIKYKKILVDEKDKEKIKKKNKMNTFPQIFSGKTLIGGFAELKIYLDTVNKILDYNLDLDVIEDLM